MTDEAGLVVTQPASERLSKSSSGRNAAGSDLSRDAGLNDIGGRSTGLFDQAQQDQLDDAQADADEAQDDAQDAGDVDDDPA